MRSIEKIKYGAEKGKERKKERKKQEEHILNDPDAIYSKFRLIGPAAY